MHVFHFYFTSSVKLGLNQLFIRLYHASKFAAILVASVEALRVQRNIPNYDTQKDLEDPVQSDLSRGDLSGMEGLLQKYSKGLSATQLAELRKMQSDVSPGDLSDMEGLLQKYSKGQSTTQLAELRKMYERFYPMVMKGKDEDLMQQQ